MTQVSWIQALMGGVFIGASATLLLLFAGKIAGISGIFNRVIAFRKVESWALFFMAGMIGGGVIYEFVFASTPTPVGPFSPVVMLAGGLLAGLGARLGQGCTSGHGVCGLGRLSPRSLVAVLTFMTTAIITVWITRHSGWL